MLTRKKENHTYLYIFISYLEQIILLAVTLDVTARQSASVGPEPTTTDLSLPKRNAARSKFIYKELYGVSYYSEVTREKEAQRNKMY